MYSMCAITKEEGNNGPHRLCQWAFTPSGTFLPTVPEPMVTNMFTVSLSIA